MPVLATSAYKTAEDVLNRLRVIVNDSEIPGGDVLTDANFASFEFLNLGFERAQLELAKVGVEVSTTEVWFIGLPIMPSVDMEARLVIDDTGTRIIYPNGVGNVNYATPVLPDNLVLPLVLWERPTGTTSSTGPPLHQAIDGLASIPQRNYLADWQWIEDGLRFRGAFQSLDVKMKYEKSLPKLVTPTDPVPIRGVVSAAAYHAAKAFAGSRGGAILPHFIDEANAEIFLLQQLSARRRQRKPSRRQPYSGRGGRRQYPIS